MLFVEDRFVLFFLAVFCVHWALRWHTARKVWLTLASYVFYGLFDWRFLSLIFASTVIDFIAGGRIHAAMTPRSKKAWLLFSLGGNLGILCFFKYYNFFVTSAADFLELLGFGANDWTLNLLLPIGISFYTFQTLSYSIDIYFGRLKPVKTPLDLALFVGFFPQLVAGPIVRAVQFLPQLTERKYWADVEVRASLTIFLAGFIKKACVSDNVAPYVDQVFSDPGAWDTASIWLGMFLFHIQVYCDFSGYSDMAIGLAGLLGYKMPLNFAFPYFTRSMTKFWQHWHITLGRWFVDYVYIPMGGNRRGPGRTQFNVFMIMFLSGLWHGSSWNFVIWGALHGIVMVWERAGLAGWLEKRPALVGIVYVHLVWWWTLSLFRTPDMTTGLAFMKGYLPFLEGGTQALAPSLWLAAVAFVALHWVAYRGFVLERLKALPDLVWAAVMGVTVAFVLPWVATDASPFIYFQF